ncbi:MAG: tRNA (guanine(10)-N(2))-dimethyltransferase [Candidatus Thorarchaeota archaeon]|jgi:tRNA (guanine26-N2/guanine27-N2)-dimethyltransferase
MTVEKEYTEGRTTFLSADVDHYSGDKKQPTTSLPVFYNPRMRLNRDLSVLFLRAYMEKHPVEMMCEPLTGSGVRTLRYLNECPSDFHAIMSDANPLAVETAQRNVETLGFGDRAEVIHGDAKVLLMTESRGKRFDFVDVDPFGTPTPYLYAAVQSISPKGGLLAVTATDMPVLCGVYPKIALRRYGGFSARTPFTHEIAVRLLNGFIYSVAGSNDCSMEPLAVLSTDHYVRTWVRIEINRTESNRQASEVGNIRYCTGCMHSEVVSLSPKVQVIEFDHKIEGCTGPIRVAGPLWIGDLFKESYLNDAIKILESDDAEDYHRKAPEVLEKMVEESFLTNRPYIDIHALCDLHNLVPPKNQIIIDKLKEQGFEVTRTHFKPTAIRTNASVQEVTKVIADYNAR